MFADVIVDLQYGDCGKGKVTHALCQEPLSRRRLYSRYSL